MSAIDFPSSPSNGQVFITNGKTWVWNGTVWNLKQPTSAGKSAYEIAVEEGFVGNEDAWLASLVGADGADGPAGADGAQGPSGSPTRTIRSVSSSTTLQSGDLNQMIRFTGTSTQVLTVADVLTPGTSVEILQDNSGSVEIQSGSGVTLLSKGGHFFLAGQNSVATLRCVASGQYRLTGDTDIGTLAIGGTVSVVGGYVVHEFTASSTLEVLQSLNAEIVVVAGGGGGLDGGGGGGGLIEASKLLSAGTYTVTVGAGGAQGVQGTDSSAFSMTAFGGGRGGNLVGNSGGSGSGGGRYSSTAGGAATQTSNGGGTGYGNAGGSGQQNTYDGGGGGGGAGGVGGNAGSNGYGGTGGLGRTYDWTDSTKVLSTGGGGHSQNPSSTGSLGGSSNVNGGKGNSPVGSVPATSASQNTGGGGGGGGASGGSGGSGIVIVRYPV